jgi:hypothetical protein
MLALHKLPLGFLRQNRGFPLFEFRNYLPIGFLKPLKLINMSDQNSQSVSYEELEAYLQTVYVKKLLFGKEESGFARMKIDIQHSIPKEILEQEQIIIAINVLGIVKSTHAPLDRKSFITPISPWARPEKIQGRRFTLEVRTFESQEPTKEIYRGNLPSNISEWNTILKETDSTE